MTLAESGHVVLETWNGVEGLKFIRSAAPDLVITDILMPEMEGVEFLMELRALRTKVKIIAISGGGWQSSRDYLHVARLLGAHKVLAKPFAAEALLGAVDELLSAPGRGRPVAALSAAR